MAATFGNPGAILDGMAPHVWLGSTAPQDWHRDVLIEGKQHGASDYFVTLGEPLHNDVTGDSAYLCCARNHDVQSTRSTGHTDWGHFYGCALQVFPRVAH